MKDFKTYYNLPEDYEVEPRLISSFYDLKVLFDCLASEDVKLERNYLQEIFILEGKRNFEFIMNMSRLGNNIVIFEELDDQTNGRYSFTTLEYFLSNIDPKVAGKLMFHLDVIRKYYHE